MIPPEGRDVQCSNCSTTWYQPGRPTMREPEAKAADAASEDAYEQDDAAPEVETVAETEAEAPPPPAAEPVAPEAEAPPPEPQRREIDPAILEILRAEAEREARLRRTEADPVESQPEMALDPESETPARAERRAELDDAVDAFDADGSPQRRMVAARDLFPDIDQINSTLRDTGERSDAEADASDIDTVDTVPRRRRGNRLGFLLALCLAGGATALYGNADSLAAAVPALAPMLEGYVTAVDAARVWLDEMAQRLGATAAGG